MRIERAILTTLLLLAGTPLTPLARAGRPADKSGIVFQDGFESGDKSKTSKDGFKWSKTRVVSIATEKKIVWTKDKKASVPLEEGDWKPKTGKHAMHFRYEAKTGKWIEQRFSMGKAYPDVWIRFWLRVPPNYYHEHSGRAGNNNKMLAVWMDGYSQHGEGPTAIWQMWATGDGGSKLSISYSKGKHTTTGGNAQHKTFVRVPQDRGRWMQLVFHLRKSSKSGAADGVLELWRRWDGETSFTQLHNVKNAKFLAPPVGPVGWRRGYLLGWANATFKEDTSWLVDDFTLATKPLVPRTAMKK